MPESTPPTPNQSDAGSDVSRSLTALADAMTSLAKSQQTVLDTLRSPTPSQSRLAQPTSQSKQTITGEFPGGSAPGAAVDFSRLTPLQQITLGLRDATPQAAPQRPAPPAGAD